RPWRLPRVRRPRRRPGRGPLRGPDRGPVRPFPLQRGPLRDPAVIIDLENLELAHGHRRLAVPRARVDISFPAECVRFDLRRQDPRAWVTATVDVPKDESPLRRGWLWQLRVARHGRLFALSLLAVELVDSTEGSCRWRRLHTWTMAIVGFTCDPL